MELREFIKRDPDNKQPEYALIVMDAPVSSIERQMNELAVAGYTLAGFNDKMMIFKLDAPMILDLDALSQAVEQRTTGHGGKVPPGTTIQ